MMRAALEPNGAAAVAFVLLSVGSIRADGVGDVDDPPNLRGTMTRDGGGPIAPPLESDVFFSIDEGPYLDTGCTFRSGGTMSPIILVHGNASDPDFFVRQGLTDSLAQARLVWNKHWNQGTPSAYNQTIEFPWSELGVPPESGRRSQNAAILAQRIPEIAREFGVDSVHIIAHSKGGLHTRDYLANYYEPERVQVISLTTLATPHNGSILADITVAHHNVTLQ